MVTLDFYKKFRPAATEKQLATLVASSPARWLCFWPALGAVHFICSAPSSGSIWVKGVGDAVSPPIAGSLHLWNLVAASQTEPARLLTPSGRLRDGRGPLHFRSVDKSARIGNRRFCAALIDMNFLHWQHPDVCRMHARACSSSASMTSPPDRSKLAGLTFATVDDKIETIGVN